MPVILSKDNNDITDLYMLEIKLNYKFPLRHIYPEKKDRIITQKDFDTMQSFIKRRIKELEQKVAYREKRRKKNKKLK
jgi:hypothetical protein